MVHMFWHTEQIYCLICTFDRLFYGFFFHSNFPRNVSRGSCVRSSIGSSLGLTHSGRKSFNSFCKILFLFLLYGYPGPCFADPWCSTVFLTRFSSRLPYIRGSWSHSRFHLTNWFAWVTFLLILASVQLDLSSSDPLLTSFRCWHYAKFFQCFDFELGLVIWLIRLSSHRILSSYRHGSSFVVVVRRKVPVDLLLGFVDLLDVCLITCDFWIQTNIVFSSLSFVLN
jgi:hypothetical protein